MRWQGNGFAGYGVGIRTGEVIMMDLDIPIPGLAKEAKALVIAKLGDDAMVRYGNRPKCGLIYRTDKPFRKIQDRRTLQRRWRKCQGEALGLGQQFVLPP